MNPSALQSRAAWGAHSYSPAFLADPRPHRDFAHAVLHVVKATGKLATQALLLPVRTVDVRVLPDRDRCQRALADVAICVCRAANTVPFVGIDLAAAVTDRGVRVSDLDNWPGNPIALGALELAASAGALAGLVDAMDHDEAWMPEDIGRALADAWSDTCRLAVRIGQVLGPFDLAASVDARLTEKGLGPQ